VIVPVQNVLVQRGILRIFSTNRGKELVGTVEAQGLWFMRVDPPDETEDFKIRRG
jgi:hypothetical protein